MAEHNELGKEGEDVAVAFLQQAGYAILQRNYVFQKAEIDIIAQKGNILVAIEVKTRSSVAFGLPQDFVTPKKIQLLVKAMNEYVTSYDIDADIRFDIIAIHKGAKGYEIDHLEDAFFYF